MKLPENLGSRLYHGTITAAKYTGVFAAGAVTGAVGLGWYLSEVLLPGVNQTMTDQKSVLEYRLTDEDKKETMYSSLLEEQKLESPERIIGEKKLEGFEEWLEQRSYDRKEEPEAVPAAPKAPGREPKKKDGGNRGWNPGPRTPEKRYWEDPSSVGNPQKLYEQLLEFDQYFGMATDRMDQTHRDMKKAAREGDRKGVELYARQFAIDQKEFNDKIKEATELLKRSNQALDEEFEGVEDLLKEQRALEEALEGLKRNLNRNQGKR